MAKCKRKIVDQKEAEIVIAMQEKIDKAEAEIKRLNKTIALVGDQLRLTALCLGGKNG